MFPKGSRSSAAIWADGQNMDTDLDLSMPNGANIRTTWWHALSGATGEAAHLSGVGQGTGVNERRGRTIWLRAIELRYRFLYGSDGSYNTPSLEVVYDRKPHNIGGLLPAMSAIYPVSTFPFPPLDYDREPGRLQSLMFVQGTIIGNHCAIECVPLSGIGSNAGTLAKSGIIRWEGDLRQHYTDENWQHMDYGRLYITMRQDDHVIIDNANIEWYATVYYYDPYNTE